jgi:predicted RNA-binding Zn-ribbon protein involved in translation (DUF1610 family)
MANEHIKIYVNMICPFCSEVADGVAEEKETSKGIRYVAFECPHCETAVPVKH